MSLEFWRKIGQRRRLIERLETENIDLNAFIAKIRVIEWVENHKGGEMMGKDGRILPLAPIDRLIRHAKVERVAGSAAEALGAILEVLGVEIAAMANDLALHAHRKTVIDSDIDLAYKQWQKRK